MAKLNLTLYLKSRKISTSSADMDSVGHRCASPMRTGAYDRMGSESALYEPEQAMLLDAALRACEKMDWMLQVVDVSKYGFMKKIRSKEKIPRLESNEKTIVGTPTSLEIIEFFCKEQSNEKEFLEVQKERRLDVY